MKTERITGVRFDGTPRIGDRSEALSIALAALKDAIEREII
jgi:hypothetical protein